MKGRIRFLRWKGVKYCRGKSYYTDWMHPDSIRKARIRVWDWGESNKPKRKNVRGKFKKGGRHSFPYCAEKKNFFYGDCYSKIGKSGRRKISR